MKLNYDQPCYGLYWGYCQEGLLLLLFNQKGVIGQKIIQTSNLAEVLVTNISQILTDHQLTKNDLNLLCLNLGPGAFNGIRISILTGQTIAYYCQIPVYGCSQLKLQLICQKKRAIILKATKNQFYLAWYNHKQDYCEQLVNHDDPLISQLSPSLITLCSSKDFCDR